MNAPANIQIINGPDGKPVFVVMHYDEYLRAYEQDCDFIPHEVVSATVDGASPARAWREYLKLTQADVAGRLGISQPSYAKQEARENLRTASINKIAAALGILPAQLDF